MKRKAIFCFFAAFLFTFTSGVVFGFDAQPLIANTPISRAFKTGERHLFTVAARESEVIEIACERRGIDVALAAFAPNGDKITVSNAPGGFAGYDRLFFVAGKTGEYRIELTARRPGNISGNYTISLKEKRAANENDFIRAEAMHFLGEAREILFGAENRYEKATRALEKLQKSLALFEKAGDLQGQANTLFQIGYVTGNEYGDDRKAVEIYDQALQIWRQIDDDAGKAICLTFAANELRDGGKHEKSLAYFNEALLLNKKLNDPPGRALILSFLCRLYNNTQLFQKGFETCRESLQLGQNADPLTDYATYTNLAALYENTGDGENSLKYYQTSLERALLAKDFLNPIRPVNARGNMGIILYRQKKYQEAINNFKEVIAVGEAVNRLLYSAYYLAQMSYVYLDLKQFEAALENAEKSLAYYRKFDPTRRQIALNAVGKSYTALGNIDKAREAISESLTISRERNDRYAEAETLYNLALLENRAGNTAAARENIHQAINISEILRADLLGKNQRSTYLSILKKYYETDIEILIKLYEQTSDAAFLQKAWQSQEKARARSLLENFLENGFSLDSTELKEFFAREQSLLEKIADAETKQITAARAKNTAAQREAEANLQKFLDEYQVLQEEARRRNPRFSALNQPREFTFAEAQNLLDADTAFLQYALGERESFAWLIGKNSVKLVKLPSKAVLNQTAREFYLALTSAADETLAREKSEQLNREVLQPLAKEIGGLKRLVIIADGSLQLVPFAALTLEGDSAPLAAKLEIVNAPSFASLYYLRENKASRQTAPDKLLAIFADPIFEADDERFAKNKFAKPKMSAADSEKLAQTLRDFGFDRLARLPFSGIEAREIAKFSPNNTTLATGAEASRDKFLRGDFASYRILHFATHGFLNQRNPDLSGLVLSLYDEKRRAQNGFLRVIDLYSLRLNADLVVLSACQTALGKDVDGEGIIGLTRGFMYAGASGIVSSLWKVEDAATAEFMKRFYRAMLKENQTPSAALRTAQNELRQIPRWRDPRNWAGFILTGSAN